MKQQVTIQQLPAGQITEAHHKQRLSYDSILIKKPSDTDSTTGKHFSIEHLKLKMITFLSE